MTDRPPQAGRRSVARRPRFEKKVAKLVMPTRKTVVGPPLPDERDVAPATLAA